MVFLGKNLNMSIVTSMGYCIEVVGKEGQGVAETMVPNGWNVWLRSESENSWNNGLGRFVGGMYLREVVDE